MELQLVALSGRNKGAFWMIEDSGLVLGRDPACDVALTDGMASRQHCRLVLNGNDVEFEDLGCRNPTLVNGLPLKRGLLKAGDEIAIGLDRFLVTAPPSAGFLERDDAKEPETGSWLRGELAVMKADVTTMDAAHRPKTIQDLVFLYETARELSAILSRGGLLSALRRRLDERFHPTHMWIALAQGDDDLEFWGADNRDEGEIATRPLEAIQKVLHLHQGRIVSSKERKGGKDVRLLTMAAPVLLGETILAVLALQVESSQRVYDEEDLRLLMFLARCVASVLYAVEHTERLRKENERLRARAGEALVLIGKSKAVRLVRSLIRQGAPSDLNILVTGATGTGKELVARLLHIESMRTAGPFVVVNCAAIPRELFESELFGYEKGAFTGATGESVGLITHAHTGTLFLDEVGDLSLENQARILRAVEYGTFRRIGAKTESHVDIRIVAATNRDLIQSIQGGMFREDLYHRLSQFEIYVPPLRERPSDIAVLAEHFFQLARDRAKSPLAGIGTEAMEYLNTRPWPGNVRELRNCIFRAVQVARGEEIELGDVAGSLEGRVLGAEEPILSLAEIEKRHITDVLNQCGGSIREAARVLQVARSTLYVKVAEYNIR